MSDELLLTILKWLGAVDAVLFLVAACFFLAYMLIELVASITGFGMILVSWKVERWRKSRGRIVTKKDSLDG